MKSILIFSVLVILSIKSTEQYNILVVFPHFGKSHFLVFEPLFEKLSALGHNLTVVSYFPREKVLPNYRDVDIGDAQPLVIKEVLRVDEFGHSRLEMYKGANLLVEFASMSCPSGLQSKNFQRFLKEDNSYDLILIEVFNTNCYHGLAKIFNAPMVGLSSSSNLPWMNNFFGYPDNPSFNPCLFMDFSAKMSFFERVENTIATAYSKLVFKYLLAASGYELSKKYIGVDMHEGSDPLYNMSMFLMNTHYSFIKSRPLPPNVVEVGGIHIAPAKPLPPKILNFINDSKDGVIYVSMGSMLKGITFPKDKKAIFLSIFSKLPQRVIWKWENDTIDGNPGNVMPIRWAPQRDIICHPNVKVYLGHGGLSGVLEALECGIPVILMPQFGDQHSNSKALEATGMAQVLNLKAITEGKLMSTLKTALSPESAKTAKVVSARFKDRPLPPMETAVFWIEYVARHQGADFMRPESLELSFYQYYLLDVAAFLIFITVSVIYLMIFVVKYLFSLSFGKSRQVNKQKTS